MRPIEILKQIRTQTSEIILFHSLAGKDSIALLDMTCQIFSRVHCIFMYMVKDLEHMKKYKTFFQKNYTNAVWYEVEHFALASYRQSGHLGMVADETQKNNSLSKIMKQFREQLNLEWVILGSKQSDGLSRRLQLKTYEHQAIDQKNKKCYPLSALSNKEVLQYIQNANCIQPLNYGDNRQSQSNDITDGVFLSWCKTNYPGDYKKILNIFPECDIILYKHENKTVANH